MIQDFIPLIWKRKTESCRHPLTSWHGESSFTR